ncbi:hypothetical protein COCC4DRAFT_54853 [Bipolaris maydis ATCC 48331]|uniref:NB-ARC domain-containing protein n=1 Tax=Cochliobolus heterostrophus (strain C4 / ATCC 48331 / race T) TaxID=665024 RepID=N4WHJ0_COCH4|nr:uncharacterized protein COCC4DRAFT_54853 [Bipolaris maydis ATCC 48331]ENH98684.1 hypothetical protein COCC4DRAFT_54853 [Bipolaris maydis ATCC 48331]
MPGSDLRLLALDGGGTLAAIATETEQTAERFRRERGLLDSTGRYYRFNVVRGLEDIGLEEAKKVKEMAATTRRYVSSQEVHQQMQACAGSIAGREYFGEYQTVLSLKGVPKARHFVDRPAEMAELERVLLPQPRQNQRQRQKIHVLRGLGGMGKTQLAVEFARRYHRRFSSVFWLDGHSEDTLKRSIASCAGRIPTGQIPDTSRQYTAGASADIDVVVKDVMTWLARPDNTAWLLIFDNVDREHTAQGGDPNAYNVERYLSGADHGSVLVTTRLARLEQLGDSQQLGKVSTAQGQAILESWYNRKHDAAVGERLLVLLDGLPLAIAQAGAYLQESGVGMATYLRFYKKQWSELMESGHLANAPLQDYPERSVWTTWAVSYQAIRNKHEATANLLLLWSFLDNKDLWHGLFAAIHERSVIATAMLAGWVGSIASSEIEFSRAMQLLCNYSLVEQVQDVGSYTVHPVVHKWAHHSQGRHFATELSRLAVVAVGQTVPESETQDSFVLQRRLLPHAQACSSQIVEGETVWRGRAEGDNDGDIYGEKEQKTLLDAVHLLGLLYARQGKLSEAEQMYKRALRGKEETLGPKHLSTLATVGNIGMLFKEQGKFIEAEQMLKRALEEYKALEPGNLLTFKTVANLGLLYKERSRFADAERMYIEALQGFEQVLGSNHKTTLRTANNLGILYKNQGRLVDAERIHKQVLKRKEDALGSKHLSTLQTIDSLGVVYMNQSNLTKAEELYEKALNGKEEVLGSKHHLTLQTVGNLGNLYHCQGRLVDAERMLERVLQGYKDVFGHKHPSTLNTINNLGILYKDQGKLAESEILLEQALHWRKEAFGPNHTSTIETINNLGILYVEQGKLVEAEKMYKQALRGYEEKLGPSHSSTLQTISNIGLLYAKQGRLDESEQMYEQALQGYEALGSVRVQQYMPALNTLENMGNLYAKQADVAKARAVYARALSGLTSVLGQSSERCMSLAAKMDALPSPRKERRTAGTSTVGESSAQQHDRIKKSSGLSIRRLVKKVF